MSDGATSPDGKDKCPECGGETVKINSTQAYTVFSCGKCEWFERVKTGRYL